MDSTSTTVTVIVAVKLFCAPLAPLLSNLLASLADTPSSDSTPAFMPASVGTEALMLPVRLTLPEVCLLAAVFSVITMVMVSPTMCARRSSNMPRKPPLPEATS
ncbi:Uncharacterised protein [Ralstonia mannitolilytica]|nr:Uncharacterised protein [Ralstonia mannitolilytica]